MFARTSRGAQVLMFNRYIFRRQCKPSKEGYKTWYCVMYGRFTCQSVLTTDAVDHIVQIRGSHNHGPPIVTHFPGGILHHQHPKSKGKQRKNVKHKQESLLRNKIIEIDDFIIP